MTRERVRALERDKNRLLSEIKQLRARLDELGPECARLRESLDNARTYNVASTTLTVVGGFLVSYATFTGKAAPALANAAAGCLLAGIFLMLVQSVLHRRKA
jgi:prefoldin subunit 5